MDKKDHQVITDILQGLEGVLVTPQPQDGEEIIYLTVTTPDTIQPASVLNMLLEQNLFGRTSTEQRTMMYNKRIHLGIVGITSTGITFMDKNIEERRRFRDSN